MKKSFKRALAAILAVMMVLTAFPMTAFAKPGDYHPDVDLYFSTFYPNTAPSPWINYTNVLKTSSFDESGLDDAALDYDYTTGRITLTQEKAQAALDGGMNNNQYSENPITTDYQYKRGDYFAVTVVAKNMPMLHLFNMAIAYSDSVEPAGFYTYQKRKFPEKPKPVDTFYEMGTVSECEANNGKFLLGGTTPWTKYTAPQIYPDNQSDLIWNKAGEPSVAHPEKGYVQCTVAAPNDGQATELATYYADRSSGALWTEDTTTVFLQTYIFKIVTDDPIVLRPAENANGSHAQSGAYIADKLNDTNSRDAYTTFAPLTSATGEVLPGSEKMTFMGKTYTEWQSIPAPQPPASHEHTFDTSWTYDDTNHWHQCTDPNCDQSEGFKKDIAAHNWVQQGKTVDPTCTNKGYTNYKCDCGATKTVYTDPVPTAHVWGKEAAFNWAENGKSATAVFTCTENAQHKSAPVTAKITSEEDSSRPATPTEKGWTKYTATATIGGVTDTDVKYVQDIDATGYTYQFKEFKANKNHTQVTMTVVAKEDPNVTLTSEPFDLGPDNQEVARVATCTVKGQTRYFGTFTFKGVTEDYSEIVNGSKDFTNHDGAPTAERNAKAPTCTQPGKEADTYCTACNRIITEGAAIPALGHNYVVTGTTYADDASTAQITLTCDRCTNEDGHTVTVDATSIAKAAGQAPTCETKGTSIYTASVLYNGKTYTANTTKEVADVPALDHIWGDPVFTFAEDGKSVTKVEATCTRDGSHKENLTAKTSVDTGKQTLAPTFDAKGETTYTATVKFNGKTFTATKTVADIPALIPVELTIVDTGLGTLNEGFIFGKNRVEKNKTFTVVATPKDGAEFVGWYENGNLLTTNRTYTALATDAKTITPVFQESEGKFFTVTFLDKWGNKVASVDNVNKAQYDEYFASNPIPTAPDVAGYKFVGWDLNDDQIKALSASQTVRAKYEAKGAGYTVSSSGSGTTITLNGAPVDGKVPFDAKVTVSNPNAKAWTVNGFIVGYGDTYTFYVGADIEVLPSFDDVQTEQPTVTMVNPYKDAATNVVYFLATRNVPDGYKLIDAGFVFGVTTNQEDLVLGNEGTVLPSGKNVHVAYCTKGGSNQFMLPYGSSTGADIGVRAFVIYSQGGAVQAPLYTDITTYTYA